MKNGHPLKLGDTIGIAAPASPFDRNEFKRGVHTLEKMGFNVFFRKDIFDQNRYLAGTDERRASELTELFQNSKIRAIMFARGGYGSQRIVPLLETGIIQSHPKPVIGFSDITALLTYLRQDCTVPTFYGPVLTMLGKYKEDMTASYLLKALTATESQENLPCGDSVVIKEGAARGPLVGGCLSIICSSIGTPYELKPDNSILFIEDIGEKLYAIDRMLTQLKNTGLFKRVKGIIIGTIVLDGGEHYELNSTIKDVLRDFNGPIISNFPAGHTHPFVTLPFGTDIELNVAEGSKPTAKLTSELLK